jgi:hypothetical protein
MSRCLMNYERSEPPVRPDPTTRSARSHPSSVHRLRQRSFVLYNILALFRQIW